MKLVSRYIFLQKKESDWTSALKHDKRLWYMMRLVLIPKISSS